MDQNGAMSRRLAVTCALALLALLLTACEAPARTHTYRIATRGAVTADVGQFAQRVAATLNDPRGWSLGGAMAFKQVEGPADFTVWLATADSLPSFGYPCDPMWSCRSGPNVIINEARWTGATPSWPYDLNSYQQYVVNHEVGHWLGLGHRSCTGGFDARAPVMVQQSKGGAPMGACRFNVWPTPEELAAVAAPRGLTPRPTGLPTPDDPFGSLDRAAVTRDPDGRPVEVTVSGWAIDGDTAAPVGVILLVDDAPVDIVLADRPRSDVEAVLPRYGAAHGYELSIGVAPTAQTVCVVAGGVGAGHNLERIGCAVIK
jgi:hypothetical protein